MILKILKKNIFKEKCVVMDQNNTSLEKTLNSPSPTPTEYPVYMIFSKSSVAEINRILSSQGLPGQIFGLKAELDRENRDTNRTMAILGRSFSGVTHNEKRRKGWSVDRFNLIDSGNETRSLCVTIPKGRSGEMYEITGQEVFDEVTEKIQPFIQASMLGPLDYQIDIPCVNRQNDIPRSCCYINFNEYVSLTIIKFIRCFLHRSTWNLERVNHANSDLFHVFFTGQKEVREDKKDVKVIDFKVVVVGKPVTKYPTEDDLSVERI